jgi:DNA-directed RNA polymerase subunit M/transcription elongation factor TFIIS
MSRTQCSRCGATLKQSAQFCTVCGTPVAGVKATPTFQSSKAVLKCSNCGASLKEGMKFCTKCGSTIEPTRLSAPTSPATDVCPHCGYNKNPPSSNFCINCGQSFSTAIPPPQETKVAEPATATAPSIVTCPSCGRKAKSGSKFCVSCGGKLSVAPETSGASLEVISRSVKPGVPVSTVEPVTVPAKVLASLMARGRQLILEEEYAKNGAESDQLFDELSQAVGDGDFELEELIDTYINERSELERLQALYEKSEVSERVYNRLEAEYKEKLNHIDEQIEDGVIQLKGYQAQIQLDYAQAKEELETLTARLLIDDDEAKQTGKKEKLSEKVERLNYALIASDYILKKESAMRNGPITRFEIKETTIADSKVTSVKLEEAEATETKEKSEESESKDLAKASSQSDAEAGKICPQCGRVTASDAHFCVHCGGPL